MLQPSLLPNNQYGDKCMYRDYSLLELQSLASGKDWMAVAGGTQCCVTQPRIYEVFTYSLMFTCPVRRQLAGLMTRE